MQKQQQAYDYYYYHYYYYYYSYYQLVATTFHFTPSISSRIEPPEHPSGGDVPGCAVSSLSIKLAACLPMGSLSASRTRTHHIAC